MRLAGFYLIEVLCVLFLIQYLLKLLPLGYRFSISDTDFLKPITELRNKMREQIPGYFFDFPEPHITLIAKVKTSQEEEAKRIAFEKLGAEPVAFTTGEIKCGDFSPVIMLKMHAKDNSLLQDTFNKLFEEASSKEHTKFNPHITLAWVNSLSAEQRKLLTPEKTKAQEKEDIRLTKEVIEKMKESNLLSNFKDSSIIFNVIELKGKDAQNKTITKNSFNLGLSENTITPKGSCPVLNISE